MLETLPTACPRGNGFPHPVSGEIPTFLGVAYDSAKGMCEAARETAAMIDCFISGKIGRNLSGFSRFES